MRLVALGRKCAQRFAKREPTLEDTLKKIVVVASAATALVCAVSLMATSGEAKTRHHKKPAAAAAPGMAWTPPPGHHDLGGPLKNGKECWKDRDAAANTGQGYWGKC
jgi:hypothetical protein